MNRALLVLLLVALAAPAAAAAGKPDPWQTAPTPERQWAAVKTLVDAHFAAVQRPSLCGTQLHVTAETNPTLPSAYRAQGSATDFDVPAGAGVNGWYVPPPVAGQAPSPLHCQLRVRLGSPMDMCDRYAHELLHDRGLTHSDDHPSMHSGGRFPACHDMRAMRSLQRYHLTFDSEPTARRCRARRLLRYECVLPGGMHVSIDYRGDSL